MIARRAFVGTLLASAAGAASAGKRPVKPAPIPPGYIAMGKAYGIPPAILYGVALQESKMMFGKHALPYPWTLNVQGAPMRFKSFAAAVEALRGFVSKGIRSVDCGLLQVNWRYHHDKLESFSKALDPYPNIGVGAAILAGHYQRTQSWFSAVGRYHNANPSIGVPYAQSVYRHIAQIPHLPVAAGAAHG